MSLVASRINSFCRIEAPFPRETLRLRQTGDTKRISYKRLSIRNNAASHSLESDLAPPHRSKIHPVSISTITRQAAFKIGTTIMANKHPTLTIHVNK